MLRMIKGSFRTPLTSALFFVFLTALAANASAGGLNLSFPVSGTPSQTEFSGSYDHIAFDIEGNTEIDDFIYVLMHYTESDPYGTEIWLSGTEYTLNDPETGNHEFGLDYYDQNYNYMGSTSYRFDVEITEAGPEPISGSVTYEYDELGRVKKVMRESGKVTSYEYDDADNRKKKTVN